MREILFKAKRKNWKELPKEKWWVYGELLISREDYYIIPEFAISCVEESKNEYACDSLITLHAFRVDPETVCQYIGLNDKNGKGIYEGDIVKDEDGEIYVVDWSNKNACFELRQNKCGIYSFCELEIEIIGNIFGNSELRKKNNQALKRSKKERKDDLISRKALISHIENEYRQWGEDYDVEQILGDIEDFSTAYDVDKIIEQQSTETNNKAILVIDMPECCADCTLSDDDTSGLYCIPANEYFDGEDSTEEKPHWCPLKKLPQKKPDKAIGEWLIFNNGYNACIDEIVKAGGVNE